MSQILSSITNFLFLLQVNGCQNYSILDEAHRAQRNVLQLHQPCCDDKLVPGWYRFKEAVGDRMPDKCVSDFSSGTMPPGWLNGTHPTIADGVVTRTVCFRRIADCCSWHEIIKVMNCSSYYVYELQKLTWCNRRYCGNALAGKLIRNELLNQRSLRVPFY